MTEQQKEYIPTYEEIKEAEGMMSGEQVDLSAARAEELDRQEIRDSKKRALEFTENKIDESENFEFYSPKERELPSGFKEFTEDTLRKLKEYFGVKDLPKLKVTYLESSVEDEKGTQASIAPMRNSENTRIVFRKGETKDKDEDEKYDKVVFAHELAHVLEGYWTDNETHPAVTFLDEGLADYVSLRLTEKDIDFDKEATEWLKNKPEQEKYLSLSELPTNYEYEQFTKQGKGDDRFSQYVLGRSFINYSIENFGLEKLKNIMKKAIDGADYWSTEHADRKWMQENMNRVFQEELGVSAEELMKKWADKLEQTKENLKTD